MKIRTLAQAEKQHDTNKLHDAFIAAGVVPVLVEGNGTQSRFTFQDAVTDPSIEGVITAYTYVAPPVPVDLQVAWQNYKTAINNASSVATLKSALTNELQVLLKELFKGSRANLT